MSTNNLKICVIGGTSGYGQGIAELLAAQGHHVIAAGRSSETDPVDVRDDDDVRCFFKDRWDFDAVIYSAGLAIGKDHVSQKAPEDFRRVFETNTLGLLNVARYCLPGLKKTQGHLIHIGSIAAYLNYPGGADYCGSKSASNSIMKTLRYELLGTGVRSVSLEVGLGATNFQRNRYNGDASKMTAHTGLIRQLEPSDLAELVAFILSAPPHVNFDEVIFKPIDQASHGATVDNLKNLF